MKYLPMLAALAFAGCSEAPAPSVEGQREAVPASGYGDQNPLFNRVWMEEGKEMPGSMLIFLEDGTLVQDSCWEVYRLSAYDMPIDGRLVWKEDGMTIAANVVEVSEDALRLRIDIAAGPVDRSFRAADAPFVCPEMAR